MTYNLAPEIQCTLKTKRPLKSVKYSKRRLRRYRGRLKETGWYKFQNIVETLVGEVVFRSQYAEFEHRMFKKYTGAMTGRFKTTPGCVIDEYANFKGNEFKG